MTRSRGVSLLDTVTQWVAFALLVAAVPAAGVAGLLRYSSRRNTRR